MKLIIEDDEGRKTVVPVVRDEMTIGRQDGNTIKLTERNVSRKHARLWKGDGVMMIEDLGSYTGVRINGDKIESPSAVKEGDLIEIGDYDLGIQGKFEASSPAPKAAAAPKPAPAAAPAAVKSAPPAARVSSPGIPAMPAAPAPAPAPAPAMSLSAPEVEKTVNDTSQDSSPVSGAGGATAIININKLMAQSTPEVEIRDLQKSEMPRLVGLAGAFRAKEFYLMRTEWKVGRTEENDLSIDHQSISRQHCKFLLEGSDWKIYDNKSANGVKVNGEEYVVAPVKPGDTVELGHVKFRFCAPGEKFSPPPEKVEGAPAPMSGKPPPTTAELIAGAQGKGPSAQPRNEAPPKSKTPMIIGAVVVAVLVIGGVVAMSKKGGGDSTGPTGEAGIKAAHAAADKHDYKKASELADAAGPSVPSTFKKKMEAEAAGQDAAEKFDAALASDPDKAKLEFDRCASENTYWCGKVKEKEEAFKQAFAKKHLAAASAAKGTNPTLCSEEVGKVLQVDSNNAEAQTISQNCSPQQAQQAATPPPATKPSAPAGPSQKDRDAMATKLIASLKEKYAAGNTAGALKDATECVDKKPSNDLLSSCYFNLGVINLKTGQAKEAAGWFKKYLPFCTPADDAKCVKVRAYAAAGD